MAYEVVMSYHLHMPSYFLGTFTEYPYIICAYKNRYNSQKWKEIGNGCFIKSGTIMILLNLSLPWPVKP